MRRAAFVACVGAIVVACGGGAPPKSEADLRTGLASPDPNVRRDSADELRDRGVPDDAVPNLLLAVRDEKNPEALSAMLLALGASGAAAARDPICQHYSDSDKDVAHAADRAFMQWAKRNPDQGSCTGMSTLQEVPSDQGPSAVPTKPQKKKSWVNDFR